ncbi:hypothetical protein TNCV_2714401 [Trichonephila clavipes]|nr:hypothetical protein TNCV_2714401 [Trichonephila clavipes]
MCEVEGAIASPRSIPPADSFEKKREGNVPDGEKEQREKEHQNHIESVETAREADAYRLSRYISLKIMKAN